MDKNTAKTPKFVNGRALVKCAICDKPKVITKTEWERSNSKFFFCSIRHLGKWKKLKRKEIEREQKAERNRLIEVECYYCGTKLMRPAFKVRIGARFQCKNEWCKEERKKVWMKARQEYRTKMYRENPEYRAAEKKRQQMKWLSILRDDKKHTKYNEKKRKVWKELVEKYPEKYILKYKLKSGKVTIGQIIKNKALAEPTWGTKSLWNGVGEWSKKYPEYKECVECNTTMYVHRAHGVCARCYEKLKYISDESKLKKRKLKEERKEIYAANRKRKIEEAREFLRRAQNGELDLPDKESNLIIMNLLNNLEKITETSRHEILTTLYSEREHTDNTEYGNGEYGGVYLKKFEYN